MIDRSSTVRGPKILVVDDDPDCLAMIEESLEWEGFAVISCQTGRETLELCENGEIALVLLDLNLLDVDGIQVCRRLRKESDVPIIILSGRSSLSDRVLGLEAGADDYVTKPCDCLELCTRIRAKLGRNYGKNRTSEILVLGALRIDIDRRTVSKNGTQVDLTKKEFAVLAELARHANRVVSREALFRSVWGENKLEPKSRVIDVHIQHLRAKLQDDLNQPQFIISIPGTGYMLSVPVK